MGCAGTCGGVLGGSFLLDVNGPGKRSANAVNVQIYVNAGESRVGGACRVVVAHCWSMRCRSSLPIRTAHPSTEQIAMLAPALPHRLVLWLSCPFPLLRARGVDRQ